VSFTPIQQRIAQLTLEAIADLGFALGGGQALHAHGYGDRLSRDLDFYVPQFEQELFDRAEAATLAALRANGYTAEVGHSDTWLRQILATEPATAEQVLLDLGQDYRLNPPVVIAGIGAVIALPDAAASKARALNDRRAARDYLDIHALLSRTPWTPARLFAALREYLRPTITVEEFAADPRRRRRPGPRGLLRLRAQRRRHRPTRRRIHRMGSRSELRQLITSATARANDLR
jgi:predicted nucleotidyltransferase component of viral defense system